MTPRQEATDFAMKYFDRMDTSGLNSKIMREKLDSLSDDAFAKLMDTYESGEDTLTFEMPVMGPVKVDVEENIAIGLEFGHEYIQQLIFTSQDPETPTFVSPPAYFVVPTLVRRTVQLLEEGISVAKDNNSVDPRTGAVTGSSATSKLSYPERGILEGMGMVNTIKEMGSIRGGDIGAWQAYEAMMNREGEASLKDLAYYGTGVESVKSYHRMLTAMHIANNF